MLFYVFTPAAHSLSLVPNDHRTYRGCACALHAVEKLVHAQVLVEGGARCAVVTKLGKSAKPL